VTIAEAPLADAAARDAYEALRAVSPQRSAFASLAFADAVAGAFGLTGRIALARSPAGEVTGGVIVYEKRLGPLRVAARPPMADDAGPILAAPLDAAAVHARASPLDALAAWAQARFHQATWVLHPSLTDARPLVWAGWRLTPAWEYHVEIRADPAGTFGRSVRQRLRAHADAYAIVPASAGEVAALAAGSLDRKGVPPPDPSAVGAVGQAMLDAGLARAWTARRAEAPAGPPVAGVVALVEPPRATYWIVGRRADGGPAATLLVDHLAREAARAGCRTLSLGGANVPGVADFKRSFGGALTPHLVARWARGPLALRDALADLRRR